MDSLNLLTRPVVPASEPFPDEIVAAILAERAARRACEGQSGEDTRLEEVPRAERGKLEGSDPFQPPWINLTYLPQLVPFRPRTRRRAGVTPFPRATTLLLLGSTPMRMLDARLLPTCGYPYSTIGRVESGFGSEFDRPRTSGTGVLVGPNMLLTATHLMQWDHPPEGWWMRFVPGFVSGLEPYGHSYVQTVHGYRAQAHPHGLDYVLGRLYTPLGKRVGWMGSQSFGDEDRYSDRRWISVGYPSIYMNGLEPAMEINIDIDDIDNDDNDSKELEVDYNDAFGGGWSGGPLFGWIDDQPRVIGVKSGWEVDGYDPARGVFAGGGPMVDLVKYGWANWQ
jgi:hypothetical protein